MSRLDNAYIHLQCKKHAAKEAVKEKIISEERGAMGIIEIIIIIAVVLVIGVLFWDQITAFVGGLMDKVFGDGGMGDGLEDKMTIK